MPRSSRGKSRSRSRSPRRNNLGIVRQKTRPTQIIVPVVRSNGLVGTVVEGAAFGTGMAIANRAVDSVAGPRSIQHVVVEDKKVQPKNSCEDFLQEFNQCYQTNNKVSLCSLYLDRLKQCEMDFPK